MLLSMMTVSEIARTAELVHAIFRYYHGILRHLVTP